MQDTYRIYIDNPTCYDLFGIEPPAPVEEAALPAYAEEAALRTPARRIPDAASIMEPAYYSAELYGAYPAKMPKAAHKAKRPRRDRAIVWVVCIFLVIAIFFQILISVFDVDLKPYIDFITTLYGNIFGGPGG